jgi:hypothetical protein
MADSLKVKNFRQNPFVREPLTGFRIIDRIIGMSFYRPINNITQPTDAGEINELIDSGNVTHVLVGEEYWRMLLFVC